MNPAAHDHGSMAGHAHEAPQVAPQKHGAMEHHIENGGGHAEHSQHQHMVADFRKRFWVSLAITVPVLLLSPSVRSFFGFKNAVLFTCLLYTSDAADDLLCVDLGGRRIIKKK